MIRFLLSLVILTLLVVYVLSPTIKYVRKFFSSEFARLKNSYEKEDVK